MAATEALRSNWRKVSSTDNLQAFAEDGQPYGGAACATLSSRMTGLGMLLLAGVLVSAELLVLVAKSVPQPPRLKLLQVLRDDEYYVYLVPLMVPMAVLAVTVNWFSLKLFKHNA